MELGAAATGSAGASRAAGNNAQAYESKMNYTVSAKPLDFSFMNIETVGRT